MHLNTPDEIALQFVDNTIYWIWSDSAHFLSKQAQII